MRGLRPVAATVVLSAVISACNALTGIADFAIEPASTDAGADAIGADGAVRPPSTSSSTSSSGVYDDGGGLIGPPILYPDASSSSSGGVRDSGADAGDTGVITDGPCEASTVGPNYAALTAGGLNGWTSRSLILGAPDNDGARASATALPLMVRAFGFTVPPTAKILGITVEMTRLGDLTLGSKMADDAIALSKGLPKNNGAWPDGASTGPYEATTYGSADDLWGATWTPAEINASTFGVSIKPTGEGFGYVDAVAVSVQICTRIQK